MVQLLTVTCMLLVLSDKGKGKQSSSEQPLVGEDHCVTTLITAAKETSGTGSGASSCALVPSYPPILRCPHYSV